MNKESIYELQKIDCNCNNCIYMFRDLPTWQRWYDYHKSLALREFELNKEKAIKAAETIEDLSNKVGMLRVAIKMQFQFDKSKLINYGKCSRFGKSVSFIPDTCQLETQSCFTHRKDIN